MTPDQPTEQDKDLIILTEIEANQDISQRELAKRTGLSLGSVNILLKKMAREGLIKMESIPANRVIYMLTPMGIAEKAAKTIRYIRHHYKMIQQTEKQIADQIRKYSKSNKIVYLVEPEGELADLLQGALEACRQENLNTPIVMIRPDEALKQDNLEHKDNAVILYLPDDYLTKSRQQATSIPMHSLLGN